MSSPTLGRRRRGANAIEFALLYPLFLWMVTGVIDYGWFFVIRADADSAVHDGARVGAMTLKKDDPAAAATTVVQSRFQANGYAVVPTVTSVLGGASPDAYITVSATVEVEPLVGLVPCPSTISAKAVMRLEDQT